MTEIRIPADLETVKQAMDFNRLLVAKEWERAAIVYAFTGVGGPRNTPYHHPPEPKVTIQEFARLDFSGLTTVKAVKRYRRAWSWAMNEGLVPEVEPGDVVVVPDIPFPAWDEVFTEYSDEEEVDDAEYFQARNAVMVTLRGVLRSLSRVTSWVPSMEREQRGRALDLVSGVEDLAARLRALLIEEDDDVEPGPERSAP